MLVEGGGGLRQEGLAFRAAAPVDQAALQLGLDEPQLVALAMDAQQERREVGEQPQGRRLVIDEHPVAPAARDLAADEHLGALRLQPGLFEDAEPERAGGLEHAAHRERLGAAADHLGTGPGAGQEGKGVDDDRFAGAGLAGQDVQTGPERDRGLGQDGQVADMKLA